MALIIAVSAPVTGAEATPEFPGVLDQTLGLSGITVGAPDGCTLCHVSSAGGASLRPFGALVQRNGTVKYEDGTLTQSLAAIGESNPDLIADIKAGVDPNDDPALASTLTPSYGCGVAGAGGLSVVSALMGGGIVAAMLRGRRPRRRVA